MFKEISERVRFEAENEKVQVEISQQIPRWQMALLYIWLISWFACGIYFLYAMNETPPEASKIVWYILIAIWSFFFFRVGRATMWRAIGKEIIILTPGKMMIRNAFGSLGRPAFFNLQHVKAFGKIKQENTFFQFVDKSFWVIGGDTLGFNYMGKKHQLGKQLSDREVQALSQVLDKYIRSFARKSE